MTWVVLKALAMKLTHAHVLSYGCYCIFSVISCGKPVSVENANMSFDGDVIGSVVRYSCLPGHQLNGAATRICGNYTWSGQSPVCKGK